MFSALHLAKIWGTWVHWWQIPLLLILIGLIIFLVKYRRGQM